MDVRTKSPRRRHGPAGLKLIVGYKFVKAAVEFALGVTVLIVRSAGLTPELREVALAVQQHAVAAWSIALSSRLMQMATGHGLRIAAVALFLDSASSLVEGWALYRGYKWSRWYVIGATTCFIPFEAIALAHRLNAGRLLLLVVNVAVVIYLIRRRELYGADSSSEGAPEG